MTTVDENGVQQQRVLFARVGWMHFYGGPVPDDERPIGGGRFNNTNIGLEIFNFKDSAGNLYGYFQPTMSSNSVALERIDPKASGADELDHVVVVFVARNPYGRQVIIGWYNDARVFRNEVKQSPGKPEGYGHFCSAKRGDCVLLPRDNRNLEIPSGKGAMGQANVCYSLTQKGLPKEAPWIREALDFMADYQGGDILAKPELDAEQESAAAAEKALAQSKGQGFPRTPEERRAVEYHAMYVAQQHFADTGYEVTDVSAQRPYDLLCKKADEELHVEVKGTTTDGDIIVLTNNEVKHACDPSRRAIP